MRLIVHRAPWSFSGYFWWWAWAANKLKACKSHSFVSTVAITSSSPSRLIAGAGKTLVTTNISLQNSCLLTSGTSCTNLFRVPASDRLVSILSKWTERTDNQLQINRLSLRNNQLKFKRSGKLPIIFRGIYRLYLKLVKKTRKVTTCNWLDTRVLTDQAQESPRTLILNAASRSASRASYWISEACRIHKWKPTRFCVRD